MYGMVMNYTDLTHFEFSAMGAILPGIQCCSITSFLSYGLSEDLHLLPLVSWHLWYDDHAVKFLCAMGTK